MKAFFTKGLVLNGSDLAVIIGNITDPYFTTLSFTDQAFPMVVSCDKIYVDGDFNTHDLITVQLGSLSNGLEPEEIDCYSHLEIDVHIEENEDPILTIKYRNFKLEHLSMELQERIMKVANEMYADKMKTILND